MMIEKATLEHYRKPLALLGGLTFPIIDVGIRKPHDALGSTGFEQRYLGNNFLQSWSKASVQRKACDGSCDGTCLSCRRRKQLLEQVQAKLEIGPADDAYEREADRVAGFIMRMPASETMATLANPVVTSIRRLPSSTGARKQLSTNFQLNLSGGRPLSTNSRQFMEPRFGVDFSNVRLHTRPQDQLQAAQIQARAFTYGNHIWMGRGEGENNKPLLAHELTHIIQQQGAGSEESIQRITVEGDCTSAAPAEAEEAAEGGAAESATILQGETGIQQAWDRALDLINSALGILGRVRDAMRDPGGPARYMPSQTMIIRKTFGDVGGGLDGGGSFTRVGGLIRNLETIRSTLAADAYTIRCTASSDERCGSYLGAFVLDDTPDVIFVCPDRFFAKGLEERAETLIHELAHSELRATHAGIGGLTEDVTLPPMAYDCNAEGFNLDYDTALNNAYAYEILIACLVGSLPTSVVTGTSGSPHAEEAEEEEAHTANEIGAFVLVPSSGGAGAEVRYTRVLLGHAPGWEFYGTVGASYLSHGDTVGLGSGVGLRYAWPWFFFQGGVGVEGSAALSPGHAPGHGSGPALNVGGVAEVEAGVDFGVIRLSGGYRLIVPLTGSSAFHPEHIGTAGISVDF